MMQKMFAICAVFATILPVRSQTTVTLGMDTNYPPYAFANATTGGLEGFGKDIADGMTALCSGLTINVVKALWAECWSSSGGGTLGSKVADGTVDGCMTYTHTKGIRDQLADFSYGILDMNKAAGLLTRLENGVPVVDGASNLGGKKVVDIGGWAPTADTLAYVKNKCTNTGYAPKCTGTLNSTCFELHVANAPADGSKTANDVGLEMLLAGTVDAMYVYADQAYQYTTDTQCTTGGAKQNCTMWAGFGTTYAYVQTGQFGYAANGTTLSLSKKGTGVPAKINSCLKSYMTTAGYYNVCAKHGLTSSCVRNSHFPGSAPATSAYNKATNLQTGACSTGYCSCPSSADAGSASDAPRSIACLSVCTFLFAYMLQLLNAQAWSDEARRGM